MLIARVRVLEAVGSVRDDIRWATEPTNHPPRRPVLPMPCL